MVGAGAVPLFLLRVSPFGCLRSFEADAAYICSQRLLLGVSSVWGALQLLLLLLLLLLLPLVVTTTAKQLLIHLKEAL